MTRIVFVLLLIVILAGNLFAADQWDKHKVALSATVGGLSGGVVGAVGGYTVSYLFDWGQQQTDQAGMMIGFPFGFAVGSYLGAKSQINRLHFPDAINAGTVTAYSIASGFSAYLVWRWSVNKYGYKKGFWPFWSIVPLALIGARIGANNIYLPITFVRF